jgi:VIT1/CCC1 family predicted Fe2+/Mn2+ transporter
MSLINKNVGENKLKLYPLMEKFLLSIIVGVVLGLVVFILTKDNTAAIIVAVLSTLILGIK